MDRPVFLCCTQLSTLLSLKISIFFCNTMQIFLQALEQKGPNNTIQYAHRYYPENYAVGDPFIPPQELQKQHQQQPPAATYGLGPAYREQQPAPVQQAYRPQPAPVQQAYRPQPAHVQPAHQLQPSPYAHQVPVHRPQNPAPFTPPNNQIYHQPAVPARPAYQPQSQLYGYGAQQAQAHNIQAQQAQRAYAQQQYQAVAPQQHLYGAGAGQRYA